LGCTGIDKELLLTTMGHAAQRTHTKIVSNLEVLCLDGSKSFDLPSLFALKNWPFKADDVLLKSDVESYDHLKQVPFEFIDGNIDILIGANCPNLIKSTETISGGENEPFATKHELGWAVTGPVGYREGSDVFCHRIKRNDVDTIEPNYNSNINTRYLDDVKPEIGKSSVEDKFWLVICGLTLWLAGFMVLIAELLLTAFYKVELIITTKSLTTISDDSSNLFALASCPLQLLAPFKTVIIVPLSQLILPRNQWSNGRVLETLKSDDGRVQSVKLKLEKGNSVRYVKNTTMLERPVSKLVYLLSE
jgi:hypothetical protein